MNAILVDKRSKKIFIGNMPHVMSKHSNVQLKADVDVYRNQSLLDLNRLVTILECFYEDHQVTVLQSNPTNI
jgi:hypothetical protein